MVELTACKFGKLSIRVFDEVRQQQRVFTCKKQTIAIHIPYFRQFLRNESLDEIDHSQELVVQCDIHVFEWLIKYVESDQVVSTEILLNVNIVVSILLSAEFLQMSKLKNECFNFVAKHLQYLMISSIDLSCLSDMMIEGITELITIIQLSNFEDPKNKILTRIFDCKLNKLIHLLQFCANCSSIFHQSAYDLIECPNECSNTSLFVNCHPVHVSSDNISSFINDLKNQGILSEHIFWFLWACGITVTNNLLSIHQFNRIGIETSHPDYFSFTLGDIERYSIENDSLCIITSQKIVSKMDMNESSRASYDVDIGCVMSNTIIPDVLKILKNKYHGISLVYSKRKIVNSSYVNSIDSSIGHFNEIHRKSRRQNKFKIDNDESVDGIMLQLSDSNDKQYIRSSKSNNLMLCPLSFYKSMKKIIDIPTFPKAEAAVGWSIDKKTDWLLDCVRDSDLLRIEKLNSYLLERRSPDFSSI